MTTPNPYDPPVETHCDEYVVMKARRLRTRRDEPFTVRRLVQKSWRRHVCIALCLGALCGLTWGSRPVSLAVGLAGFWAGLIVCDIQWYRMAVAEWDSTKELLDWEKIERLAG